MTMCIRSQTRRRSLIESSVDLNTDTTITSSPTMEQQPRKKSLKSTKSKREIQHNYHDHALDDGKVYMETPLVSKGGVTVPFPMKLHNMLEHIAEFESELEHIVSWQPHGRCFLVHKIKEFQADVLPRFFQQRKYASFQRQLNLYGFSRLTKGPDRGAYYHELFLRSKQILCRGIYRMKVKGTGSRMASNPDQEPNFYQMSIMPPSVPPSNSADAEPVNIEPLHVQQETTYNMSSSRPQEIVSSSPSNYESYFNQMPMPVPSSYNRMYPEIAKENDQDQTNVVFDMQFHELSEVSRRHSLMIGTTRRLSMKLGQQGSFRNHRGSLIINGDNDFDKEMEMIAQLGDKTLSDNEMGDILDKIIDHRIV
jgi:hypothetical protein